MGKSTISMAIFNSYVAVYQRVVTMMRFMLKSRVEESQIWMEFHPTSRWIDPTIGHECLRWCSPRVSSPSFFFMIHPQSLFIHRGCTVLWKFPYPQAPMFVDLLVLQYFAIQHGPCWWNATWYSWAGDTGNTPVLPGLPDVTHSNWMQMLQKPSRTSIFPDNITGWDITSYACCLGSCFTDPVAMPRYSDHRESWSNWFQLVPTGWWFQIPSGKLSHNYGKIHHF